MKKMMLVGVMVIMMTLMGCVRNLPVDQDAVQTAFQSIEVPTDYIFANQMNYIGDQSVDRMEMVDASDRTAILIHVIVSSEVISLRRDYRILITTDWIYREETMSKEANLIDPTTEAGFKQLMQQYTTLIDLDLFSQDAVYRLARSLKNATQTRVQNRHAFRGERSVEEVLPQGVLEVAILEYEFGVLKELHFRREFDYPSTKQQSNYISGTHYFFSQQIEIEFPALSGFSE